MEKQHRGRGLWGRLLLGQSGNAGPAPQGEALESPARLVLRGFLHNKVAMTGAVVFLTIFLSCFLLPFFFPMDPNEQDLTQQNIPPGYGMLSPPAALAQNARQIAVGSTFAVGIDREGNFYSWGQMNEKLQKPPKGMGKLAAVAAGLDHILALGEDGALYTWGNNRFGLDRIPEEVRALSSIRQVLAGYQISLVLGGDGRLYHWGNENVVRLQVPEEIQGRIRKVALNVSGAFALLDDGSIRALGGAETALSRVPAAVQGRAVDLAVTDSAAAAVTEDGGVATWGGGDWGQLEVPAALQTGAVSVAAGRSHFTALTKEGAAVSWGRNHHGQAEAPQTAGAIAVYAGYYQNYAVDASGAVSAWGLKGYLLGTDHYGRDLFPRLLAGGRLTLTIGAIAVILSTLIGVLVGGVSGYYGGKVDNVLMRMAEIVMSIPFLPLAMILSAVVGNSLSELQRISMIMVILGVLSWPGLARLVRAQVLAEREKEFVTAAKAMGIRQSAVIFRHILPNVLTVVIVNTTLSFASCLLTESALSFLGFGVVEPNPTWGNMLTGAQNSTVIASHWWRWVFPSLALSLATISVNLIGDGLRDAIDPKSGER
jgi:peptide/nickel transport system permease protein